MYLKNQQILYKTQVIIQQHKEPFLNMHPKIMPHLFPCSTIFAKLQISCFSVLKRKSNHKVKRPSQTCYCSKQFFAIRWAKLQSTSYSGQPGLQLLIQILEMSFYLCCPLQRLSFPLNTHLQHPNQALYFTEQQQLFLNNTTLQNNFSPVLSTLRLPIAPNLPYELQSYTSMHSVDKQAPTTIRKRGRACIEKQLKCAKKNRESNLINQLLSFLKLRQKSQKLVQKAVGKIIKHSVQAQKVCELFYNIVRLINIKRGRKCLNENFILQLFTVSYWRQNIPGVMALFSNCSEIFVQEVCCVFRSVCYDLIRNQFLAAVLTSNRISVASKKGHLKRIRTLEKSLRQLEKT